MARFCKYILAALLPFLLLAQPATAFDTNEDTELLLLVNGTHRLSASYTPSNLVNTAQNTPSKKGTLLMRREAADAYYQMIAAYKEESKRSIYSISGYRDFAYQQRLFNSKVSSRQSMGESWKTAYNNTLKYTARPGTSEHQTGLAIDLSVGSTLANGFRNTAQGQWLLDNCWDYGYILRYDKDKTQLTAIAYEPWHYRYVGLPHSLIMRDNDWVLEEYIDYLHKNGSIVYATTDDPNTVWHIYWTDDTEQNFKDVESISRDNAGGYIITVKTTLMDELLTAWAKEVVQADGIMPYLAA